MQYKRFSLIIKIDKIDTIDDILSYYWQILDCKDNKIEIDLSEAKFIRTNCVCILGLIIEQKKKSDCEVSIIEPKLAKVRKPLVAIGFLTDKYKQNNVEMICYKNIKLDEKNNFYLNFETYFKQKARKCLSNVSNQLFEILTQKILELFSNAFRHSESEVGIFCSGHFFPKNKKFSFVIVDGGVGIKRNVTEYLSQLTNGQIMRFFRKKIKISGVQAIRWAIKSGNSTTGIGGLGLDLIREFIIKNEGNLEIISSDARYSINNGKESYSKLDGKFIGTLIAMNIKVDEYRFFKLKGEIC